MRLVALGLALLLLAEPGAEPAWTARDGSDMVLIPAGAFPMGEDSGQPDQSPRRRVDLPAFYLGRTEVTNRQFRRFLEDASRPVPEAWREAAAAWGEDAPAVCVSFQDAEAYCAWAGLRLPTEEEWEKAARGPEGRAWPWGVDFDPACLVVGGRGPEAVGSHPSGASPYGLLDMAGNAQEWTSSWYAGYPGTRAASPHFGSQYRVVRGGNWRLASPDFFRTSWRSWSLGAVRFDSTGFRVACDRRP